MPQLTRRKSLAPNGSVVGKVAVILVGDDGIGKNSLVLRLLNSNSTLVPTRTRSTESTTSTSSRNFHEYTRIPLSDDGSQVELELFTAKNGPQEQDAHAWLKWIQGVRPYPHPKIVLLCYCINNPESFENVRNIWFSSVKHHLPGIPIVLLGMKKDLRRGTAPVILNSVEEEEAARRRASDSSIDQTDDDSSGDQVHEPMGAVMAKEIKARAYLECSSVTGSVMDIFQRCATIALQGSPKGSVSNSVPKSPTKDRCVIS